MPDQSIRLSSKALTFVLKAIEFKIAVDRARLELDSLSEDERADLGNDANFLESVLKSIVAEAENQSR